MERQRARIGCLAHPGHPGRAAARALVTRLLAVLGLVMVALPYPALAPAAAQPPLLPLPATLGDQILTAAAIEGTPLLAALIIYGPPRPPTKPTSLVIVDTERGRVERLVEVPEFARQLAVDANRQRLFIARFFGRNADLPLARYDLATGQLRPVPLPFEFSAVWGPLVVNPATGRLYVGGALGGLNPGTSHYTLVFDTDGRFQAELPYTVVAVDPGLNRLYATAPSPSGTGLRLLAVDGLDEQARAPTTLLTLDEPAAAVLGLVVDRRRHEVLALTCTRACFPKTLHVFDGVSGMLRRSVSRPEPATLLALNEATGRYYVATHGSPSLITGADQRDDTPRVHWHPSAGRLLAVDGQRNRLYFDRSANQGRDRSFSPVEEGRLAVAVADGATDTVLRLFPLFDYPPPQPPRPAASTPDPAPPRIFPETGRSLSDPFRQYWEQHGGLAAFGYPITDEFAEYRSHMDWQPTTQYFERAQFWLAIDPVSRTPSVRAELLGLQLAAIQAPVPAPGSDTPERRWFPATGHTLAHGFKHFWETHGGVAVFGYPITEEFREVSPADGRTYTVQYFERARFEHHPEHQGTPYEIQLGLLGRQVLVARGWLS